MTLLATAPPQLDRSLTDADPEVADAVHGELGRQQQTLEMIASENFAPLAVMQAQGSVLTNKYAEGYPGRRYYGGCEHVDVVEQLALDRVKALFGAEAANVQPHSGAQAYFAGLVAAGLHPNPVPHAHVVTSTTHKTLGGPRGGVILSQQSLIKKINSAVFPGQQGGPLEHVIAAKAVTFKLAAEPEFAERQQRTIEGARVLAQRLGGTDLAEHGVSVLTGGTDVHLVLVDLRESALDGKQAEDRLHRIGITVNRNAVPFDPRPPMISSGLRIGTPALATRGFGAEEFAEVADIIAAALAGEPSQADLDALQDRVGVLAQKFPLYAALDRTDDSEVAA